MRISLIFDSLQEGLAAIDTLTGAGVTAAAEVVTDTAPDPTLGVPLDSKGFPWVESVHAGTKGKNQDGTWKNKKGVTPEVRAAAEIAALNHLRATAAPAAPAALAMPTVAAAPAALAMPITMPGLPVAAVAVAPITYEQLTEKYVALATAGLIDATVMGNLYAKHQVNPADLTTNETARRLIYTDLVAIEAPRLGMPGV